MGINANYSEVREKAIKWLNSKNRDFKEGVNLLSESGYKPNIVMMLQKKGETEFTIEKLRNEIYSFVRFFAAPEAPIHQDATDDELKAFDLTDEKVEELRQDAETGEYPDIVKQVMRMFADAYQKRSIMHRKLTESGDSNDSESMAVRAELLAELDSVSETLDRAYPLIDMYRKDGSVPTDEQIKAAFNPPAKEEPKADAQKAEVVLPETAEELEKLKKNLQSKLAKKKNRILYRSDIKQTVENPLPEGAERLKYEKEVEKLTATIEAINVKLVELS